MARLLSRQTADGGKRPMIESVLDGVLDDFEVRFGNSSLQREIREKSEIETLSSCFDDAFWSLKSLGDVCFLCFLCFL